MSATTSERDVNGPEPDLKRVMGPGLLLLFIVGDILGAGVYAVTGKLAGQVGGIAWLPFLVAFIVATLTAYSYLELVCKYPQAAGAALYTHKAFGIHFVTFLVAFAVVCSGIASASTSSGLLANNLLIGLHEGIDAVPTGDGADARRRTRLHGAAGADQPARRGREREVQRRPHPDRDGRAGHRDHHRLRRHRRWRRRPEPDHRLREPRPEGPLRRGHHRHGDRVLLHGRLRGLGQHGRGGQGARTDLPEDDAHRARHRGDHLHARGRLGRRRDPRRGHPGSQEPGGGDPPRRGPHGRPGHPDRQGVPVHDGLRRGQHRAHQHADGQPADLRDGQPGRAAPWPGQGTPRSAGRPGPRSCSPPSWRSG